MRIVHLGLKGIPATFGGIEHHVEQLSAAQAALGHDVVVYVRGWYVPRGRRRLGRVRLVRLPSVKTKHLDAALHTALASLHVLFRRADVIHYHAIGPALFSPLSLAFGRTVVVTVHRLDWQTPKWGPAARLALRAGEFLAAYAPQAAIVVSADMRRYFEATYGRRPALIAHGLPPVRKRPPEIIRSKYGLEGGDYALFMGRLSPEKRADWLIRAFLAARARGAGSGVRLVIAGGSSASGVHLDRLREAAGGRPEVVFTGYVTGAEKEELLTNARLFVLPSSLEGSPIALLEAKTYGLCCLASRIPCHEEILRDGETGFLFDPASETDLTERLTALLDDGERREKAGRRGCLEMANRPTWDEVARLTLEVYREALAKRPGRRSAAE